MAIMKTIDISFEEWACWHAVQVRSAHNIFIIIIFNLSELRNVLVSLAFRFWLFYLYSSSVDLFYNMGGKTMASTHSEMIHMFSFCTANNATNLNHKNYSTHQITRMIIAYKWIMSKMYDWKQTETERK